MSELENALSGKHSPTEKGGGQNLSHHCKDGQPLVQAMTVSDGASATAHFTLFEAGLDFDAFQLPKIWASK